MVRVWLILSLAFGLVACASVIALKANPSSVTPASEPLRVNVFPEPDVSLDQVVGFAPFAVHFYAQIRGGVPPYIVAWNVGGARAFDRLSASAGQHAITFTQPGVYFIEANVTDSTNTSLNVARRIVVVGEPEIPNWKFGITAHLERRREGYYPTLAEVARAARLMRAAGIQFVRADFTWSVMETEKDQLNWSDYDAVVHILKDNGLELLPILDYTSWWHSSSSSNDWRVRLYSEPDDYDAYARFVYQVVSHYKQDIHLWQIWNEPNTVDFWKPQPNATHYVELLRRAFFAVKYADPQAVVVLGGLSGNGIEGRDDARPARNFLAEAYTAGAQKYFDIAAIHPYAQPIEGLANLRERIHAARRVMEMNGDAHKPLWVTEIGVPTNIAWWSGAPVITEPDAALWLIQVYGGLSDQVGAIVWYDFQDMTGNTMAESAFGLIRADWTLKPEYDAYQKFAKP